MNSRIQNANKIEKKIYLPCFVEGFKDSIQPRDPAGCQPITKLHSKPVLWAQSTPTGIVLIWDVPFEKDVVISRFEMFARLDTRKPTILHKSWHMLGSVNAKPLPMACELKKLEPSFAYYITLRAVDIRGRAGPCSDAVYITGK